MRSKLAFQIATFSLLGVLSSGVGSQFNPGANYQPAPTSPNEASVDYGVLQFPRSMNAETGMMTPVIYGRVFEAGVTEDAGPSPQVVAQLGVGPAETDPRTDPGWTWIDASYNRQIEDNDEYQAPLTAPGSPGLYAYAYRFALVQDGMTSAYTYADLDGAGSNPGLSFDAGKLGALSVTQQAPNESVDYGMGPETPTPASPSEPNQASSPGNCNQNPGACSRAESRADYSPLARTPTDQSGPVPSVQSQAAKPASLGEQVRQLQSDVAALQTIIEQMQSRLPEAGDHIVSMRSPTPNTFCSSTGTRNANDILTRAYNLNDASRMPYPDGTLVMMWSNCRSK